MNSNPIEATESGKNVNLPKPDPANITVLTPKLPNKPILPWTHFDSPWLEKEEGEGEGEEEALTGQETSAENQESQLEASTDEENTSEATETQIEASTTDSNPSDNSDTPQEPTTQQTTEPKILTNSSQLPENSDIS
ncbi:MAG: hypothetical protein QNJ51_28105 [Calothrix sp. MO_167.B12]|nr:hypothetical protein [Calothrix sp. MO_167.B12]